jgi:hypothetical protein
LPERSDEHGADPRRVLGEKRRIRHVARMETELQARVTRHDVKVHVEDALSGGAAVELRDLS